MTDFNASRAFLVAIDGYVNDIPVLKSPVRDAEMLAKVLHDHHGFEAKIIANGDATGDKLRIFLTGLASRIDPDDRVVFYFAGHGIALPGKDGPTGYILPQDALNPGNQDRLEAETSFLPMTELDELLSALPCRHMLVILDCCYAGAFRWGNFRNVAHAPEDLYEERYRWFVEGRAWQAIASAAHDERALDVVAGYTLGERDEATGHSPFARALIDGLNGGADRAPAGGKGDGVITATELYQHIDDALQALTGGTWQKQMPILWPMKKHDRGQFVFLVPGQELKLPSVCFGVE